MKVYIDTSVLLHIYFKEPDSEAVLDALRETRQRVASALVFVELASVFRRAVKAKKVTRHQLKVLKEEARRDLRQFRVLSAGEELFRQAALVADLTGLRSLDAIHLASARMSGAEVFWTFDQELVHAARELGFRTRI